MKACLEKTVRNSKISDIVLLLFRDKIIHLNNAENVLKVN